MVGKTKRKKDPNMPKRGMSAFIFFSNHRRPLIKADNPSLTFGGLAKAVSVDFRALTADEMKVWQAKAAKDKARYLKAMESYVPPSASESDSDSDGPRKKKPKKKKKDPNAPKKGMSAFMLFSVATRPRLKAENPSATFGDLAKLVGKSFKALSEKELKKWQEKAAVDKKRYEKQMANYKKAPSSESEQSEEEVAEESSAAESSEEGSGSDSGSGDSSEESDSESD
eukprot:CAMPEP_0194265234 /NCGR_PEP_ID=MMETSP0169-20130528/552_1 /TAXON_ID=218684 /ORGANISM="Corethron pennatum, Strain L29A3" /LENGTH=225 /DNA_ID=CAMNT_0039005661 /DNA_START=159 /DNA_END=836 /DNA_ORIENTATION=-